MENNFCPNCMEKTENGTKVCSACGYKKEKIKNLRKQLPIGSIVGEKYLIGRAFSHNKNEVYYLAYDMDGGMKVTVHEYFPQKYAKRDQLDKQELIPKSSKVISAFVDGKNRFEAEERKHTSLHKIIFTNDTVYAILNFATTKVKIKDIKKNRLRLFLLLLIIVLLALILFFSLRNKSAKEKSSSQMGISETDVSNDYNVGTTVEIGTFWKDADIKPIEWIVLRKEGNKALVITKDCITSSLVQPWTDEPFGWDESYMRNSLNNNFYEKCFTELEKRAILEVEVLPDENPDYNVVQGEKTQDKIFLLSVNEAKTLFENDKAREAAPTIRAQITEYGIKKADNGNCEWWLRTNSDLDEYRNQLFCVVDSDGKINTKGVESTKNSGVRPAMWVEIPSVLKAEKQREKSTEDRSKDLFFGNYMGEKIEWWVFDPDEDDGKIFLVSKYCVDCQPYHTEDIEVTWEACSLRKWLNNDFYNSAFTEEERKKISAFQTEANCMDFATILSYKEIVNLFGYGRFGYLSIGTPYATQKYIDDYNKNYASKYGIDWEYGTSISWWTRTSEDEIGVYNTEEVKICMNGEGADSSLGYVYMPNGIRPVIVVNEEVLYNN